MVLRAVPKRRGGKRGQGNASFNRTISDRLKALWSGAWRQLLSETDLATVIPKPRPEELSEEAGVSRDVRAASS